jgi:hypothetical protein
MNERQKKKNFKKVVSEIVSLCNKVDMGHKGDVIIFSLSQHANVWGGRNLQRLEAIFDRCRETGIEAFAISSLAGLDIDVYEYDAAIDKLEQTLTELKEKRDQLNK